MALTADQRRLYVRQILLPEVGAAGQARLCETEVPLSPAGDPRALAVAEDYLRRAGVATRRSDEAPLAPGRDLEALAPDPRLREAAAVVAGAFAAVEEIKRALGVGQPGALPERLRADRERARP